MRLRSGLLLVLLFLSSLPARAGDGVLDPAFGSGGLWTSTSSGSFSFTRATMAPDGALVVFGSRNLAGSRSLHWRRILPSGAATLCSIAVPGVTGLYPGGISFDYAGRMLFSARVIVSPATAFVALMRFNYPSCQLDTALGGDGLATIGNPVAGTTLTGVSGVQPVRWFDGQVFRNRILVSLALDNGPTYDSYLLRLLEDGSVDSGFGGGDGFLELRPDSFPVSFGRAHDGQYLVAGGSADGGSSRTFVEKFDRNGAAIAAFGVGGAIEVDLPGSTQDALGELAVGPDGRIALAGSTVLESGSFEQGAVAVLTKNGDLDLSFSGDGWTTWAHLGSDRTDFRGAVFQGDGRLLLAGTASDPLDPADDEAFAIRLLPSGPVDGGFGTAGLTWLALDNIPGGEDLGASIELSDDGRIWLAGSTAIESSPGTLEYRPFVARMQNSYIFADGFERGTLGNW